MNYWRIEIDLNLENNPFYTEEEVKETFGEWVYNNNPRDCFLEFERKKHFLDDKECPYRYLIYPKEWIKQHPDFWKDGYVIYTSEYRTPKEILSDIFEGKSGTITNTSTNELLYQH